MAKYPVSSPLYHPYIRELVGAAVFAEIAISLQCTWEAKTMELTLDGKGGVSDDLEQTGKYAQMKRGKVPSPKSCSRMQKNLNGGHLLQWRNHPYWALLTPGPLYFEAVIEALLTVEGTINEDIWESSDPFLIDEKKSFRYDMSPTEIEHIAEYGNFHALLVLTAMVREAKGLRYLRPAFLASKYSLDVFPKAVCTTPHLYIAWPKLFAVYSSVIWSPLECEDSIPWFEIDSAKVFREIEVLSVQARNRGIKLPPDSIVC
jgi:hypothetical protein